MNIERENKSYKATWGNREYNYFIFRENTLGDYEKKEGFLSEKTLFHRIFSDMILCNDIINYIYKNNDYLDEIVSNYDEEENYYKEEYQYFIVNWEFDYDEEDMKKLINAMGNTLYYNENLDIYIMGVCDLGTSRDYVLTDIKLEEYKNDEE